MRCDKCKIEVNNLSDNCPLCGKYLTECIGDLQPNYPNLEKSSLNKPHNKLLRLMLFLIIAISIITLTVNLLTSPQYLWGIIPVSAMWLVLPVLGVPFAKKKLTPLMLVLDNITICIFLVIINSVEGSREWAMSYVVPFVLFGSALIVTIIVLCRKMTWRELFLFQLSIAAICFIPVIASRFFDFVFWPSAASAVYGIITIVGMLIFGDKSLKYETKKRFHF